MSHSLDGPKVTYAGVTSVLAQEEEGPLGLRDLPVVLELGYFRYSHVFVRIEPAPT